MKTWFPRENVKLGLTVLPIFTRTSVITPSLGVGFVSLNESLDLTTPSGRAIVGMLAVFAEFEREILRERVKAGIIEARANGKAGGRPRTAFNKKDEIKKLYDDGLNKSEIARIGRTSVIRVLNGLETR